MNRKTPPLVIFTLDSANYELIEKWADEGYLPNLTSIMQTGSCWELGGPGVYDEIGSWLSLFSGVSQVDHGYYASRRLKPGSYELEITDFEQAGVVPFWGLPDSSELSAAILDVPEPFIVPGVKGIQLRSLQMHYEEYASQPTQSEPPELAARVLELVGPDEVSGFGKFDKPQTHYVEQLHKNLERMNRRCEVFRQLLDEENYDLSVIGFAEMHDAGHLMWQFDQSVRPDIDNHPELVNGLRTVYQEVDKEIGLFLQTMSAETRLMILSTYGLKSQYPVGPVGEQLLERLGYSVPANRSVQALSPLSIARKIIPKRIRHYLSRYLEFNYQQRLVHENFANETDWSKTRAFTIPSLYQNWLRVNLAGREPKGIVGTGDYQALLDEIEHQFRLIIDPVTGEPAVSAVLRPFGSPQQDPCDNKGPDLIIHWKSSRHFLEKVNHPSGDLNQARPHFYRDSFHKFPGFAFFRGDGINSNSREKCGILDIAPTCMDLLNIAGTDELAGTSLLNRFGNGSSAS